LKWEEDLKKKYKCFGIIEPGDPVIVEDEPVIQNGMVAELGSVRKARR
jgi:hypothetical protein